MHEDTQAGAAVRSAPVDNVVAMADLSSGRLADLLAAAGGPGQPHELRGEFGARAAYWSVASSWPSTRRRRRTPAMAAVTTVATLMVATTGLAAASQLPGPAGQTAQGILGSVGVVIPSVSAASTVHPTAPVRTPTTVRHPTGPHDRCATLADSTATSVSGRVETSSCTIPVPAHGAPTASPPTTSASPVVNRAVRAPAAVRPPHALPVHQGGDARPVPTRPATGTALGGGTSRGGNLGAGGGTCPPVTGTGGSTTTTTTTTNHHHHHDHDDAAVHDDHDDPTFHHDAVVLDAPSRRLGTVRWDDHHHHDRHLTDHGRVAPGSVRPEER